MQNRLDLVLPAIRLAAQEDNSSKLFPTFSAILPGWSIRVDAADTSCSSIYGGLEAARLRCSTGSIHIQFLDIYYNSFIPFNIIVLT